MFLIVYYLIVSALAAKCTDATNQQNCEASSCNVQIGSNVYCSQCKTGGNVPIDGVCKQVSEAANKCQKTNDQPVSETDTTCGKCLNAYFMYKGGCYLAGSGTGGKLCAQAENGICSQAVATKEYFVPPNADASHDSVVSCGDATGVTFGSGSNTKTYKGVDGCGKCDAPSPITESTGAQTAASTCTECSTTKIVKTDKDKTTTCVTEDQCKGTEGFFVKTNDSTKTCEACSDENCATCAATSKNQCSKCKTTGDKTYLKAESGSTGTCVEASGCGSGFFPKADDKAGNKCTACGSASDGGIDNCAECSLLTPASRSSTVLVTCTKCGSNKYLKSDGSGCGESSGCASGTEFAKEDTEKGNKCIKCNDNNNGGIESCSQCTATTSPARSGTPLVTCSQCTNKKVRPDKKGCIDACPANSNDNNNVCECASGYAPSADGSSCASASANRSGLSTGAIAGISVAAVVVVGGLVGFLCWWFVCRGKA